MDRASRAIMRQRDFGLLWWGGLVSYLGTWMLRVALPISVLELTGSTAALAITSAASFAPNLILGPLVGVLVDRWDRKRVMVVANLAHVAVLAPLLLVHSESTVWIIPAVAFTSASIAPFNSIAENALLPRLVAEEHLTAANSLNAVNDNLARFVGPVIGGAVSVWAGLSGVALIDAATYLAAAGMIALVRGRHRAQQSVTATGNAVARMLRELRDGFATVRGSRLLWILFGMLALLSLGEGVMGTVFVVWVKQELSGGAQAYGLIIAAQAIGGVAGGLAGGWIAARMSPRMILGLGFIAFGLCDLTTFNYPQWYPSIVPALVIMAVVGIPSAVGFAAFTSLIQLAAPDRLRGRVFALRSAVMSLCLLAGSGIAALTAERVDVVTVLSVQACTPILAGIVALVVLRSSDVEVAGDESTPLETATAS